MVDRAVGVQNFNNSSFNQFNFIQVLTESEYMLQFAYKDIDMVVVNMQVAKTNKFKIAKKLIRKCINSLITIVFSHRVKLCNFTQFYYSGFIRVSIGSLDYILGILYPDDKEIY